MGLRTRACPPISALVKSHLTTPAAAPLPANHLTPPTTPPLPAQQVIDITWPVADGPSGLSEALARVAEEAGQAIDDGYDYIVLSDRRAGERLAACAALWRAGGKASPQGRAACPTLACSFTVAQTADPNLRTGATPPPPSQAATAWPCPA